MTTTNTLVAQIRVAIRLQAALARKAIPVAAPIHSTHTAATLHAGAL